MHVIQITMRYRWGIPAPKKLSQYRFISTDGFGCVKHDSTISIEVEEGVYEPAEDSYLLLESIEIKRVMRVLEVGTGSGFIALHCAKEGASVTATDISPVAANNARLNAERNGISIDIIQTDLTRGVSGKFDIIIFNPPYITGEDSEILTKREKEQLVGGEEGYEISIRFLEEVRGLLREGGSILLLTSSQSEGKVLDHAKNIYEIELLASKELFFEKLSVNRFKPKIAE